MPLSHRHPHHRHTAARITLIAACFLTALGAGAANTPKSEYRIRLFTCGPMPDLFYIPGDKKGAETEWAPDGFNAGPELTIPTESLPGGALTITGGTVDTSNGKIIRKPFTQIAVERNTPTLVCIVSAFANGHYTAPKQIHVDLDPKKFTAPGCMLVNAAAMPIAAAMGETLKPRVLKPGETLMIGIQSDAVGAPRLKLAIGTGTGFIRLNRGRLPIKTDSRTVIIVSSVDPKGNGGCPGDIRILTLDSGQPESKEQQLSTRSP